MEAGDGREGDGHEGGGRSSIWHSAHLSVRCAVVSAFASSMVIVPPPLLNVLGSMPFRHIACARALTRML